MAERLGLLSLIDGDDGYCALLAAGDGASALRATSAGASVANSQEPVAEGRAVLGSQREQLEISWTPAGPGLELDLGGALVAAQPIAASGHHGGEAMAGPGVAWELPAGGYDAIRTLWAVGAEGELTLLVALRPEEAVGHGDELVGAARLVPGAEPHGYVDPLLSTEYDEAGVHVRATLELWAGEQEPAPQRGGGLRASGGSLSSPAGQLAAARFAWRLGGAAAAGGYEILTP